MLNILEFDKKVIIGMIHLSPMEGLDGFIGKEKTIERALNDLYSLQENGIDAVIVENEHDHPHTIFILEKQKSCMLDVTKAVTKKANVPVGVCVLRNDWKAALEIAKKSDAEFIRMDVFVDKVLMENEIVEVNPIEVMNYKRTIKGEKIKIFTDIHVKHSIMLENKTLFESAQEAIKSGSDAIIISGKATGKEININKLKDLRERINNFPILIGSGFSESCVHYLKYCSGAIVGTSLKENNKISVEKVKSLIDKVKMLK